MTIGKNLSIDVWLSGPAAGFSWSGRLLLLGEELFPMEHLSFRADAISQDSNYNLQSLTSPFRLFVKTLKTSYLT